MKNLSYPSLQRMGPFMVLLTDESEESLCSLEAHSHKPFICVCNSCMALQCEQRHFFNNKVSRGVDRCWNTCTESVKKYVQLLLVQEAALVIQYGKHFLLGKHVCIYLFPHQSQTN